MVDPGVRHELHPARETVDGAAKRQAAQNRLAGQREYMTTQSARRIIPMAFAA